MDSVDLILRHENEGGLLDQMSQLDKKMNAIQNELQQQELRFKQLHDERNLLEQLHTINQMTSRKINDEVFGDGSRMFPSRRLFLERLPDPNEFAKVAHQTAQRNLEEGAEDAQQILDEVSSKDPMSLLHDEIVHVLETSIRDPRIEMRIDPITEMFLGCAIVTCASLDEAERALTNLTGRWLLPPSTDQPVQIHYIDESAEPKVVVEGLGPDVSANTVKELLSHYGSIEDFEGRERRDRSGLESATVKFSSIDDTYVAISLQHNCPIPPAIYDIEMVPAGGNVDELAACLHEYLEIGEYDVELIHGPDRISENSERYSLSVSISSASPEQVIQLIERTSAHAFDGPRVTAVHPPPLITLRLPKKRKKIRPEDQEQLVLLDDKLKLEKEKTAALDRELRQVLEPQLKAKRDAAHKASSELETMRQATGWDERKQFSTQTQLDRENQISELLNELAKLQDEQTALRRENAKKTTIIEGLAKTLLDKDDTVNECMALEEQLREKEVEYQDRVENVRTLKRILNKKGKLTDELMRADDTRQVKALESDKRVLQHEISRHVESRRAAEKTIQAQHHRLTQLDNRIKAIASALRELRKPDDSTAMNHRPEDWQHGDDTVAFAVYNSLQHDLIQCRKKLMSKDQLMLEKDSQLEALEKKIEVLGKAKVVNMRIANRELKLRQAQYDEFREFKQQQQAKAETIKEEIVDDTADLKDKYKRIRDSMYGDAR
ncbi:hypothetical protein DIPPA_21673 [Diplonema papillatum]|nr:hypothetical protein DIPPA_21673 [Diplonema papillatum]